MNETVSNFYNKIFSFKRKDKVLECINKADAVILYNDKYKNNLNDFKDNIKRLHEEFVAKKDDIPKNVYKQQLFFVEKIANLVESLTPTLNSLKKMLIRN